MGGDLLEKEDGGRKRAAILLSLFIYIIFLFYIRFAHSEGELLWRKIGEFRVNS